MTPEELRSLQWRKLAAGLDETFVHNRFYREKLGLAGLRRSDLRSLDDLGHIPFTTKAEVLADQAAFPPYGSNLSRPAAEYTRLHQTSGTSGQKLRWLDTPQSWQWFLDCWQEIYEAIGVGPADRLFFPFSFGPFIGFWAAFEAAIRRGCFVLPAGGMTSLARLQLLIDNRMTFVLCTPTYAMRLADVAETSGVALRNAGVRGLILAGEPGAGIPATRDAIETAWNARVFDHSGMTEIGPLGVEFAQFPSKLFILENHAIGEVVDPNTFAPTPEGEIGELVLTNLGRWHCPLIRYRTGDLVRWRRDVHPPGLPFFYCDRGILGRTDEMLWIRGNNVYPSAIEAVLRGVPEVCEFAIEVDDSTGQSELTIRVEPRRESPPADLASRIVGRIQDELYFRPRVEVVAPGSLPRFEMKARRLTRKTP